MLRDTRKEKASWTAHGPTYIWCDCFQCFSPAPTPPSPLLPQDTSNTWNNDALSLLCFTQLISRSAGNPQLEAQDTKLKTNEHSQFINICAWGPQFWGTAQGGSHLATLYETTSCLSSNHPYGEYSWKWGPWGSPLCAPLPPFLLCSCFPLNIEVFLHISGWGGHRQSKNNLAVTSLDLKSLLPL